MRFKRAGDDGYSSGVASRTARKGLNSAKTKLRRRQGPAQKDQRAAPIADAIRAYHERDMVSFAIPAHGGGIGPAPEVAKWAGLEAVRSDLPMSHGVDTRDRAWGVQSTAQKLFAEAVGAKQTLFSTNGSSMSVHVAMIRRAIEDEAFAQHFADEEAVDEAWPI
jgi:arginine decarboxylase